MFEAAGRPVIIAENALWGNDFAGESWLSLGLGYHNREGCVTFGGHGRWDSLQLELPPFREGGERVILPQRGIGPKVNAMPSNWAQLQKGRLRPHPGNGPCKPLKEDLAEAGEVVTWASGAAIKALMLGCRVESHMPFWIGWQNNTEADRLEMLQRLAWSQWRISEIRSGEAFRWLLK